MRLSFEPREASNPPVEEVTVYPVPDGVNWTDRPVEIKEVLPCDYAAVALDDRNVVGVNVDCIRPDNTISGTKPFAVYLMPNPCFTNTFAVIPVPGLSRLACPWMDLVSEEGQRRVSWPH